MGGEGRGLRGLRVGSHGSEARTGGEARSNETALGDGVPERVWTLHLRQGEPGWVLWYDNTLRAEGRRDGEMIGAAMAAMGAERGTAHPLQNELAARRERRFSQTQPT